jgi:hypothetical protein
MTIDEAEAIVAAENERVARIEQAAAVLEFERRRKACGAGNHYAIHDPRSDVPYCGYCGVPLPTRRRR